MGMVAALKFNNNSGAMISDEEFWNMRFRRKLYCDNLHSLLDPSMAEALNLEVVYGGTGYPPVHHEIVLQTRQILKEKFKTYSGGTEKPFSTVAEVGKIALDVMQEVVRKRIDLRMKFFYGFDSNDLIQGSFDENKANYKIEQDAIKQKALRMLKGEEGGRLMPGLMKSSAAIFGWDNSVGFTGYYLDFKHSIIAYNFEGWEAIGAGKYGSGLSLGRYINRQPLLDRRQGSEPDEGMLELLTAGIFAIDNFQNAGGNINIVLIDGAQRSHASRYREIFDDVSRFAVEIVRAHLAEYISRKDAIDLIERLLFKERPRIEIEKQLYKRAVNPQALELLLRGYKLDEIPLLVSNLPKKASKEQSTGKEDQK